MENIKEIIAKNLVFLRKSSKMTQQELAARLNYSDKAISRWEHAETLPDIETLCKVCEIYGVKFEYLLQAEQPSGKKNPYVIEKNIGNKIAITGIAIFSVWLIATLIYVYTDIVSSVNLWQIFIWAIPFSCLVASFCNRLWGTRLIGYILLSLMFWSLILSVYTFLIEYNPWMLFLTGIPIQMIIILSASVKKK